MCDYQGQAKIYKAFCDEHRLRILALLQDGEKCACKLIEAMGMGQSTLSYHMKILCESGIVVGRQEGKWVHYRIDTEGSQNAISFLQSLTTPHAAQSCECGCSCGGS